MNVCCNTRGVGTSCSDKLHAWWSQSFPTVMGKGEQYTHRCTPHEADWVQPIETISSVNNVKHLRTAIRAFSSVQADRSKQSHGESFISSLKA